MKTNFLSVTCCILLAIAIIGCVSTSENGAVTLTNTRPDPVIRGLTRNITIFGAGFSAKVRRNLDCGANPFDVSYDFEVMIAPAGAQEVIQESDWIVLDDIIWQSDEQIDVPLSEAIRNALQLGSYHLKVTRGDGAESVLPDAFTVIDNADPIDTDTELVPVDGVITARYAVIPPRIDGDISDSMWSFSTRISKILFGNSDNLVTFDVLWDETYLYIAVRNEDFHFINDSPIHREDDGIEVFIDPDYSRSTVMDMFDKQFVAALGENTLIVGKGGGSNTLFGFSDSVPNVYSIELAVPWTELGVSPTVGHTLGLDFFINDDDDGGLRESLLAWQGENFNYNNTSAYGAVVLSTDSGTVETTP